VINVLPGRCLDSKRLPEYRATFKQNLRYAAEAFAPLGIKTVFEAVNSLDMPGFIIDNHQAMLEVLNDINHPAIGLQYDIYHMSRMHEDCLTFLQQHLHKILHIQFADCPGRGQPGTGDIDFASLFRVISAADYQGWVGAEYIPKGLSTDSLDWFKARNRPSS
jgi:hydroxypyruvate isomerase